MTQDRAWIQALGVVAFALAGGGCLLMSAGKALNNDGVGVILFKDKGLVPAPANTPVVTFDIECVDSFEATGGKTGLDNAAGIYGVSCTYQGAPMKWPIVATFSAAPMANTTDRWKTYRGKVTKMAEEKRCSAVALRTSWPTKNQEGEALGAFCVKT